ncbi:MAG TPA: FAD-dependent oxidoreductase [Candidatus Angelobacter sp.]|nr:FAD-dependent oxidoreductase [Candidatus Angelobacter sp.]
MKKTFDFAVVGAGVFGVCTARCLRQSGASVVLLDAYGPGNSRSSSGGETRIIRAGYGPDELYTRWAIRSFTLWREFLEPSGWDLFHRAGVLWLGRKVDPHLDGMYQLLNRLGVSTEKLDGKDIRTRYPQLSFDDVDFAVLEAGSGVMLARRAVQYLVADLQRNGAEYVAASVGVPPGTGGKAAITISSGERIDAGTFVFACGPWLPKLFPDLLRDKIFPTRQEVFFLGPPAGNDDFSPARMPAWLHHSHPDRPYALPDIENRGFKIALDTHGPEFDPDSGERVVSAASVSRIREYLRRHVPGLHEAPVVETRVCQYENTWNGDFLIDRHPGCDNIWVAGGGSGHGFKHGPAVGEYLAARILRNAPEEPRFSLAAKKTRRSRAVF